MAKELDQLHRAGLLDRHQVGNQVQFCANAKHPVFPELSGLLRKTVGLADVLVGALAPVAEKIAIAFVCGSIAGATEHERSDVDVIIIGSVNFA